MQPRVVRLTAPLLGGLGRDLLYTVGWKPAHLAAGAALPETPLSDAQNWTEGRESGAKGGSWESGEKMVKNDIGFRAHNEKTEQCVPRDH